MARTIPTTEPTELIAGDSWEWDRSFADYPASSWSLSYVFSGPQRFTVDAGEDGDTFEVRVTPATTGAYAAGTYQVLGRVTDGTDVYTVFDGTILVRPNLATASPSLSHAETTLAVIEAAIEGRLTADVEDYQVAGRAVKKIPIRELVKLRGLYAAMVWREQRPTASAPQRVVRMVSVDVD